MKGDRERCLQAGASDYIAKPVNTDELLALLSDLALRTQKPWANHDGFRVIAVRHIPMPATLSRGEEGVFMTDIQAKILLVDDDARSLMAMETLLTGPGRVVITADSGHEALRQVLRHDFAVILLDVRMPRVDGFEAAELIRQREQSRHTPIIFLSAVDKLEEDVFRGWPAVRSITCSNPWFPLCCKARCRCSSTLSPARACETAGRAAGRASGFKSLVDSIRGLLDSLLSADGR